MAAKVHWLVIPLLCALVAASTTAAGTASSDWTRFGYDAARGNAAPTGIDASSVSKLKRRQITIDGTVDSSAIYLRRVVVRGARHDTMFVTTTYGKTLAVDASSGHVLWRFVPPRISGWAGGPPSTTPAPPAHPQPRPFGFSGPH